MDHKNLKLVNVVTFNNELHYFSKKKHPKLLIELSFFFPFLLSSKFGATLFFDSGWVGHSDCLVQGCLILCGRLHEYHQCLSSLPRQLQAVLTHSSFGVCVWGGGGTITGLHVYTLYLPRHPLLLFSQPLLFSVFFTLPYTQRSF